MSGVEPPVEAGAAESSGIGGRSLDRRRARGLTLWSIVVLVMSPFSIPTFGMSGVLAAALVMVAGLLQWRGLNAKRPLVAGVVALCLNGLSAGACSWLVLRTAEVTGIEAVRQEAVEDRFDEVFKEATRPPTRDVPDGGVLGGDAGPALDADSPTPPPTAPEERR